MKKNRYVGSQGREVRVNGKPLPPRTDIRNHSPTGFAWGYGGSGPSQLALAILAWEFDDDDRAFSLYQQFKWDVIANLDKPSFQLDSDDIKQWLNTHEGAMQESERA